MFNLSPLPATCPEDTDLAGWFLSPTQHLIESPIVTLATVIAAWKLGSPAGIVRVLKATKWTWRRTALELVFLALAILSFGILIVHKIGKGKLGMLLQPCHVCHMLLIITLILPPGTGAGAFAWNLYNHWLFAPFFGMVAAELDCYQQRFELFNYFLQHGLLLAASVVFSVTRRHPQTSSYRFHLFTFALAVFHHFATLEVVDRVTGLNVNYMYCPITALIPYGRAYRMLMIVFTLVVASFSRYILLPLACWAVLAKLPGDEGGFWTRPEEAAKEWAESVAAAKKGGADEIRPEVKVSADVCETGDGLRAR